MLSHNGKPVGVLWSAVLGLTAVCASIACWILEVSEGGCDRYRESSTLHAADAAAFIAEEACVDRWLDSHGLDVFGSPEGTLYPGGSPTFDEKTGRPISRLEFVYAHHPEARSACRSDR